MEKNYKDLPHTQAIVFTNAGGSSSCGFDFKPGTSYLLYVFKDYTGEWGVSTCSRTVELASATDDLQQLGQGAEPNLKTDVSGEMRRLHDKNVLFYARRAYHGILRQYKVQIVAMVFIAFVVSFFFFYKKGKRE